MRFNGSSLIIVVRDVLAHFNTLMQAEALAKKYNTAFDEAAELIHTEQLLALCSVPDGAVVAGGEEYARLLVRSDYMTHYAKEHAHALGLLNGAPDVWPHSHVDWENASDELAEKCMFVEFDGRGYYLIA